MMLRLIALFFLLCGSLWATDSTLPEGVVCKDGVCEMSPEFLAKMRAKRAQTKAKSPIAPVAQIPMQAVRILEGAVSKEAFLAFLANKPYDTPAGPSRATWLLFLLALGGGFLLNFTPCVLPLVPVNLILMGKGWKRGCAYGLGIALSYGSLGLASAFGGVCFGALQSGCGFNLIVGCVFFLLSLSMAGVLPFDFLARFHKPHAPAQSSALSLGAPFLLGIGAALLAGACVAPVALATCTQAAVRVAAGNPWAAVLPLALGVGMALPYPFLAGGLKVLPRPGKWMVWVRRLFALVLAGFAIYYGLLGYALWKRTHLAPALTSVPPACVDANLAKPLFVKIGAPWCKNCTAMDRSVLQDEEVLARLGAFDVHAREINSFEDLQRDPLLASVASRIHGLPAYLIFPVQTLHAQKVSGQDLRQLGLQAPEIGLGWTNRWVAAWHRQVAGLDVRDTAERVASNLVKCVRRWTWHGSNTLRQVTLSVRCHVPGNPHTLKPFIPGILLYGNPSNKGRTDRRVSVYAGETDEFALFEDHRLPMPFVLLEESHNADHPFTAVHIQPSPLYGARRSDLWWSAGVEARETGADILLLSGPVGYNRMRSVVKATQGHALDYDEAYIDLAPGQIIEKTFWIQTGRATSEAFGFEQALDVSLACFNPYDETRYPSFDEIVRKKHAYALTRWYVSPTNDAICGFNMFDAKSNQSCITMGWCGCAATCGYALPVLDLDKDDWSKAQRSLDFLTKTFLPTVKADTGLFAVTYDIKTGKLSGGDPVSCGQGLYSILKAIRFAEENGRGQLNPAQWRIFAERVCENLSSVILRDDWQAANSACQGFLIAPLVLGADLFARPKWRLAAEKMANVLHARYFGYESVYWGGTLDASCEDKEGAYAAFQGYVALLRDARRRNDKAAEAHWRRPARHAMNVMLTYTMVWDATYPPGRLSDHAFKSTGWTVVSAQNQHLDAFGVLTTPEIDWMGKYLNDARLCRLARVMFRSCFQLTDDSGSLGEQIQQTNFAQRGDLNDVRKFRGGYAEGWTVFWLTAHFLNAAAQLK